MSKGSGTTKSVGSGSASGSRSAVASVAATSNKPSNPFSNIVLTPLSDAQKAALQNEGVNLNIYEAMRRDERDQRIDEEYRKQVDSLRLELREKYPLSNSGVLLPANVKAQAKLQKKLFNKAFNDGVRRLRKLASEAKKK